MKNLTREKALELHRQMWTDMQRDLGNTPNGGQRVDYKRQWCHTHFSKEDIENSCFLCEYAKSSALDNYCKGCPIRWPYENDWTTTYCTKDEYYYKAPISEILALPERRIEGMEKLYRCTLEYNAEGRCSGYMYLTKQEYETVKKVVNTDNWSDVDDEGWSGRMFIYCEELEEK